MKTALVTVTGISPYSPSSVVPPEIMNPEGVKENGEEKEKRVWRYRIHADDKGRCFIPPMALKNMLTDAGQFLGMKFKGQRTYGKLFESGIMVLDPLTLDVKRDAVPGDWLFLPSDGKRGGGKRVWKCYARIFPWGGVFTATILNDEISEKVFAAHVEAAGQFVGLGRFRPARNGYFGRFTVDSIEYGKV